MAETGEDVPDGLPQHTDVIPNGKPLAAANPLANGERSSTTAEDQVEKDSEDHDLLKEYHFGIRSWHPQCLQILANKKFFLFMLCMFALLQGSIISGLIPAVLSTIQQRYQFSSTLGGFLSSSYDIVVFIAVIFMSYLGGKTHRPRFLGICFICNAIGALFFSSPQWFLGRYDLQGRTADDFELCITGDKDYAPPDCSPATNGAAYFLMILGQIFIALGASGMFTVGTGYLDEIVHPRYVSIYIGTFFIPVIVGPALGFGIGSAVLSIYVDISFPEDREAIDRSDEAWVGAWWLGFLLVGILSLIFAIPFFMFPKWLPDSYQIKQERLKEQAKVYANKYAGVKDIRTKLKIFAQHFKHLFTNVPFVLLAMGFSFGTFPKDGLVAFGPKLLETMFSITATTAGLVAGGIGITTAAVGIVVGALLIFCFKLTGKQAAIIPAIVLFLSIPTCFMLFIKCPTEPVAGITVPYPDGSQNGIDNSTCFSDCQCASEIYEPVCGDDGRTYYSPCRAGCLRSEVLQEMEGNSTEFYECSCIEQFLNSSDRSIITDDFRATNGVCGVDCGAYLYIFVLIIAIFIFFGVLPNIPFYYMTLRVVSDDQRHLALGVQSAIYRLVGSIPGPLVYGALFDDACAYWQTECGVRGNCAVYDRSGLALRLFGITLATVTMSFVFLLLTWLTYPKKPAGTVDEEKVKLEAGLENSTEPATVKETTKTTWI